MDITNGSDIDTRYTVKRSVGLSRTTYEYAHPFAPEDIARWPLIPAGSGVEHTPASPGPWKVCFFVNGQKVMAEAKSDNDQVNLVAAGGSFKAEVRRVPEASSGRAGAVKRHHD